MSDQREAVTKSKRIIYGPWCNNYIKSLKATGAFAEALCEAGYDPDHPATKYPVAVFLNLMDVTRRHLFPDLPPSEGYRRVGRLLVASYIEGGISGKLWAKAFPIIGPDLAIRGVEKFTSAGSNYLLAKVTKVGDKHWHVAFRQTGGMPGHFIAGTAEYALGLAGTPPGLKVVVTKDEAEELELDITW